MSYFPDEFNLVIYKQYNTELKNISDYQYIEHYYFYGKTEGRVCSLIKNRIDFINLIDQNKNILEIGPLHNPCMDQSKSNIKNMDYFTKEELIEIYKNDKNVDLSKIYEVDYVIKEDIKYNEIIREKFDICFSSHNIEHTPCIITFLNNISSILNNNGFMFLCIPDFRYCFDRFRNETTIFDILDAYLSKKNKPSFINLMESRYLTTNNNSIEHWNRLLDSRNNIFLQINDKYKFNNEQTSNIINNFDSIIEHYDITKQKYIDTHCWKFNPNNFNQIINILYIKKLIDFKICRIYPTLKYSNEFYVILNKVPQT